jgi:hypothetical protein
MKKKCSKKAKNTRKSLDKIHINWKGIRKAGKNLG